MLSVEFLGPSGVGKSYLYNQLFKAEGLEKKYLGLNDAYVKAALNFRGTQQALPVYFLKILLTSKYWHWKKRGIAHKILTSVPVQIPSAAFSLSSQILDSYLAGEADQRIVQKRQYNFRHCIQQFLLLERSLSAKDVVVFDEGMVHYHHGLSPEIVGRYSSEQIRADKALSLTAAISIELAPEIIIEQALKRRAAGVNTFSHAGLTEKELKEYILNNIEEYKRKIAFLEIAGIPVLKVNNAENSRANILKINSFLNSFSVGNK